MQDNKKLYKWLHSVAGITAIILFIISVALLLFVKWFVDDSAVNFNSFLIGLATNLLGIIVTVSFVQYFIDKQNIEKERREEAAKILRYHKIMILLIERYTLFFECVTSTI
jgi:uncharacterized membrane protein